MKQKRDRFEQFLKIFIISFFSISILFLVYAVLFANKALPNTYFSNLNVSGRNQEQISRIIEGQIETFSRRRMQVKVGQEVVELNLEELGVVYDIDASIQNVFDASLSSNPFEDYKNRLQALFITNKILPDYSIDKSKLSTALDERLIELEKEAQDATITFLNQQPKIEEEKSGVVVDRSKLIADIRLRLDNFSTDPITAVYIHDDPVLKTENAQSALEKVTDLDGQSITLTFEFDNWTLEGEKLAGLLDFNVASKSGGGYASINFGSSPATLTAFNFDSRQDPVLEVKLDEDGLDSYISNIAQIIDKETVDATLEFDGMKVSRFTPAQDGRALNKEKTKNAILSVISIDNPNIEKSVTIQLPVNITKARIANEEINSLGIKELIGSGVSYFTGSIPNRGFNIGLGASFVNGTVVAPGEVFSFNEQVGPVSAEQGFKQAYVINKGRTVLDDGGGICQVSTTVFRAALNTGLPIVERTAHAYRVTYYEQRGFGPGLDATIWSPTVDLKFKNDTPHHILVQAIFDSAQSKLQVDIYGTSDGRTVEITEPVLSNRKPAPEPLHQDDPTLPAGTTKQVDWAAEGLTSVFSRKVFKNGEVLIDEQIKSNFRPWQAVYLVGTGA